MLRPASSSTLEIARPEAQDPNRLTRKSGQLGSDVRRHGRARFSCKRLCDRLPSVEKSCSKFVSATCLPRPANNQRSNAPGALGASVMRSVWKRSMYEVVSSASAS